MNKQELVAAMAEKANLSKKDAEAALAAFIEAVEGALKAGDKVIFAKYGGTDIKYEGEEYTIMRQSEILAVIE